MRKLTLLLLVAMLLAGLVACKSASPPAPAPSPVPAPTPAPSPAPLPSPAKTVEVNVSAQGLAFDTNKITVSPGANVKIIFNNKDSMPHNVAIYTDSSAKTVIFRGDVITGPKTITYEFVAPTAPGAYFFRCDIHPSSMNGSFVVAP